MNGDQQQPTPSTAAVGNLKSSVQNATYNLRERIEQPSVVILFLLLVYVDILLGSWSFSGTTDSSGAILIEGARSVILYLQLFEQLIQMIAFPVRFFSHWGYAIDSIIVAARMLNLFSILSTNQHHLHLLSFLRAWRFVRIVQAYEEDLSSQIKSTKEWKKKAVLVEEDVEREKVLSRQNQTMVKEARDEIDTLREALQIAAVEVAAARKGQNGPNEAGGSGVNVDVVEYASDDHETIPFVIPLHQLNE